LENQKQLIHRYTYTTIVHMQKKKKKIQILFLGAGMITTIIVDVWQRMISQCWRWKSFR
jgi:hypothetical protein